MKEATVTVDHRQDVLELVPRVHKYLSQENFDELSEFLQSLRTPDVLRLLNRLNRRRRAIVYRLLDKDHALWVFERLSPSLQWELLETLQEQDVISLFTGLGPDDRVRLLDELPATVAARLLR